MCKKGEKVCTVAQGVSSRASWVNDAVMQCGLAGATECSCRPHLDRFLFGPLVVVGLLVLLRPLGEVGVVGQFIEERRHHGVAVHLLLQGRRKQNVCTCAKQLSVSSRRDFSRSLL